MKKTIIIMLVILALTWIWFKIYKYYTTDSIELSDAEQWSMVYAGAWWGLFGNQRATSISIAGSAWWTLGWFSSFQRSTNINVSGAISETWNNKKIIISVSFILIILILIFLWLKLLKSRKKK